VPNKVWHSAEIRKICVFRQNRLHFTLKFSSDVFDGRDQSRDQTSLRSDRVEYIYYKTIKMSEY